MYLFRKKISLQLLIKKKHLVVPYLLRLVYQLIYFFVCFLSYKKISVSSYKSPFSIVKNKRSITLGKWVEIRAFSYINAELDLGDYTQINPGSKIYGKVKVGKYVMIAPNVMLAGGNHNFSDKSKPMMLQGSNTKNDGIVIKDDVWIGANVCILDGVYIASGIIVAAGSVVTKDLIIENGIYAGMPAKFIKSKF
jgi:acetyltransferase-like isoleucine patch superfamily enzyme